MTGATPDRAEGLPDRAATARVSAREFLERQPRWALILRGIAGVLLGVIAFLMPGLTFVMLIALLAAYMLVDGALALVAGVRAGRSGQRWWPYIVEGGANLGVAAIALLWPGVTGLALVYLVAVRAIFTGVMLLIPNPDHAMSTRVLVALAGIASVLLGIAMIAQPVVGSLAVVWMVGIYGLTFGSFLLAAGLKGRSTEAARSGA